MNTVGIKDISYPKLFIVECERLSGSHWIFQTFGFTKQSHAIRRYARLQNPAMFNLGFQTRNVKLLEYTPTDISHLVP